MRCCTLVLYAMSKLFIVMLAAGACRAADEPQQETPDAFKVFEAFPHPIGVMDTNSDSILECLSARRTEMDPKAQTATYVWSLTGSDGKTRDHVPFYHMAGDTPDATRYTVGSKDAPVEVGHFLYTDYKDCAILQMVHYGDQCTLWVSKAVRNSIPAKCLEQYADLCGEGVSIFDQGICKDSDK